jgi:polar amino acid transport system permease protein
MGYSLDFSEMLYYAPAFRTALLVTLRLTTLACIFGTILGLPIAGLMLLPRGIGATLSFFVDIVRSIPDLVLFFFFYYFPYSAVLGSSPPSPFGSALLAMTTVLAFFTGDLFRESIRQAPRNQILGLRGIGFKDYQVLRYVVVPSVIRHTLPALIAFWIGILKMSSLASVIGVNDVVYVAKIGMAQSYRSLEAWITVALIYIALVMPAVYGLRLFQRQPWIQRQ